MKKILGLVLAMAMCGIFPVGFANAAVWTDKADYSPGSVVTISADNSDGAGFIAGETVTINVTTPYGSESGFATVGVDGSSSWQFTLPNDESAVGDYSYTTTGLTSGVVQSGVFTDAIGDFTGTPGPANFTATTVSNTQINLSWIAVPFASHYHIERSTNNITWVIFGTGSTNYSNTGLTPGTSYLYRIRAHRHSSPVSYTNYSTISASTRVNQTITITAPAPASAIYDSTFQVAATTSSGLPVAITTLNCSGGGTGLVTIRMTSGTSACTILYNQAGNGFYNPATQLSSSTVALKKAASVTPNSGSKTYGDTDSGFSGTLVGFVSGDGVSATYSRTVGESVASSPRTISATLSPIAVLSNYNITYNTAIYNILPKALTPSIVANNKPYDGTSDATIASRSLATIIGSDDVSLVGGIATFANKNVGTGKTVTETGLSLIGAKAGNYSLTSNTATDTANITARAASVTPNSNSKTADSSEPILSGTLVGFVSGDGVTANYSRSPGESVVSSPYTISATLSPIAELSNYDITYNTANFTISGLNLGSAAPYSVIAGAAFTEGASNIFAGGTTFGLWGAVNGPWKDASDAFVDAASRTATITSDASSFGSNTTLTAGVYRYSGYVAATGTLTLDGQGDPNAVFIFQIGGYLSTEVGFQVLLTNGANASNVFWQVGGYFTPGASTSFNGTVIAGSYITTGADVNIRGRLFALNGAVTTGASSIIINSTSTPVPAVITAGVSLGSSAPYSVISGAAFTEGAGSIFAGGTTFGLAGAVNGPWKDASDAYADAAGRTAVLTSNAVNFSTNQSLTAGVYKYLGYVAATGTLTLDGQGDPNAVFIFQIGGYLSTEAGFRVVLTNGANASNIFWQVGGYFTPGASTNFSGTVIAGSYITTGADVNISGRLFALNGAVTTGASNTIN